MHVSRVSIGPRAAARLRVGCVLQHGQGDPGISINGSLYYYYWDTDAVLQSCEHYRQSLLPPRAKDRPLFHRPGPIHQPTLCSHTVGRPASTVATKPVPFLTRKSRIGMPSDKTLATLYPVYSVMPCPHKGAEKGAEEKNRPRLRPIMENFTFPRPTGIHSATQAVGPRVPKAGARVVFRTEPLSDIPPFRGAFTGFPTPFEGRGGRPPAPPGREARRWAPFMFREYVFSHCWMGTTRQSLKSATQGYGMCQFCPVISSAQAPQSTRLTARGLCTTDVKYHNPAPLPRLEPTSLPLPFSFSATLGMNRGTCARPVSEGHATALARAHGHVVTDSRQTTKKEWGPPGWRAMAGREAG